MIELHIHYREERKMNREAVSGILSVLLLIFIVNVQLNIIPVKAQPIELYYDDGEVDQGDAVVANRTTGWAVNFGHPEPGIPYRVESVKFYIFLFMGEAPLRLFLYLRRQYTSIYEKVYANIVNNLTVGWNIVDLTRYKIVAYHDFIVGFNWVVDQTPYLGVDVDTESHSGTFETYSTTYFKPYHGFFNYMIRTLVTPPAVEATVGFKAWGRGKWIPAYIELPEGLSVSDINISTVKLNDTISIGKPPPKIRDYNKDDIPDLMVKFNRDELLDWLAASGIPKIGNYYYITLTIAGKLTDDSIFEGSQHVRILDKGK